MQTTPELERMLSVLSQSQGGEAWLFVGVADELGELGYDRAEELAALALDVVRNDDWAVAILAGTLFLQILRDEGLLK